jgi:hypothetical protein
VTYDVAGPSLDSGQDAFAVRRYTWDKASSRMWLNPCSELLPERCRMKRAIPQLIDLHKSFLPFWLR